MKHRDCGTCGQCAGCRPRELTGSPLDVPYMLINSVGRAALDATAAPGLLQPWIDRIEAQVRQGGKFSRRAAGYLPLSPPPAFWDYKCHKCRWWNFGACKVVDGEIQPRGWCAIWVPAPAYKAFTWTKELLKGDF